jgi:7-cyano-7-deazaguanine synthase
MKKLILIASGGLDSTVLYYFLKKKKYDIEIINFNYGSKHNKQERKRLKENIKVPIMEINIDLSFLNSSLLKGNIPEGHYKAKNMKSTIVPFRNGIMLSYAASIAESENIKYIAIGSHAGDHYIYPDCTPMFNGGMREAVRLGTGNHVIIETPFSFIDKAGIVDIGKKLNINDIMFNTWTCYNGREYHCGKCGACVERKEAFQLNNIKDLTRYE